MCVPVFCACVCLWKHKLIQLSSTRFHVLFADDDDLVVSGWGEVDDMREDLLKDWGELLEKWDGRDKMRPSKLTNLCRKVCVCTVRAWTVCWFMTSYIDLYRLGNYRSAGLFLELCIVPVLKCMRECFTLSPWRYILYNNIMSI